MNKEKLFIVILKYIVELEEINKYRKLHLEYLDEYYSKGNFIVDKTLDMEG